MNTALTQAIIAFRSNYLGFGELPAAGDAKVIAHNQKSEIPANHFIVFAYAGAGTIISVDAQYFQHITDYIAAVGYSEDGLKQEFITLMHKEPIVYGPVISLYLFSIEKLLPRHPDTRQLSKDEKNLFDDFVATCIDGEMNEVDMRWDDPTQRFFVLSHDDAIVSLGNYSTDETGIAHIGIVTPHRHAGNGYGTVLVNTITHDILSHNMFPQYRAKKKNLASLKIAESLGFEAVVESYTLGKSGI